MNYRLLTPGPVPVPPSVLKALARPVLHHRTPEFETILTRVLGRLPEVFQTQERVYLHTSTGTGAMESAIVNCFSPGDEVLVICAGKFGERWAEIAKVYGLTVHRYDIPWGQDANLDQVRKMRAARPALRGILCQACETSTGAWLPVRELAEITRNEPELLLLVDAITALGAVPMPMDAWGLDVVIAGSQKALMLPTGLSFIAFSKKAWRFVESARCPRFYWDIRAERKANEKNQTRLSSAVSLICALDAVLEEFHQKGLQHFHQRTEQLARATRAGIAQLGLSLFPKTPSPSLSCIQVPNSVDGQKLRAHMEKAFQVTIMGGQDELTGKVIRIGHMGAIEDEDLLACISALGKSLKYFDPLFTDTQIESAVQATRNALMSRTMAKP